MLFPRVRSRTRWGCRPTAAACWSLGDGDIWIYDLASGRGSRVTKDGRSQMGVWDPTGTRVAYSSQSASIMEAWVVAADGSDAPRQLTHDGGRVHVDSWSPDGRIVSVHRHTAADSRMLMIPVDRSGDPAVVFADGESAAEGASFALDGRFVAYHSRDSGVREILRVPVPWTRRANHGVGRRRRRTTMGAERRGVLQERRRGPHVRRLGEDVAGPLGWQTDTVVRRRLLRLPDRITAPG